MKEKLREHIAAIFQSIGIDAAFKIFEYGIDIPLTLARSSRLNHQFLITTNATEYRSKLEALMGKQVKEENGTLSWSEGVVIDTNTKSGGSDEQVSCSVNLPEWLDQRIFDKMGSSYAPSGLAKEFNRSLDLTLSMIQRYLGTYLPRSYAESYSIFCGLFSHPAIRKVYSKRKTVKMLCVGGGTGGDTLGFLDALNENFPSVKAVQITAIEGNRDASSISAALIEEEKEHVHFAIDYKVVNHILDSFEQFDDELEKHYTEVTYDFVLSSKMLNELVSSGRSSTLYSYGQFVRLFLPLLKENGLLLLLDITSKPEPIDLFIPQLMNQQINNELRKTYEFKTILPIPCGLYEGLCKRSCFTQKNFYVSHSRKQRDKSKVCYRVITRTEFADKVLADKNDIKYVVVEDKEDCCPYSASNPDQTGNGFCLLPTHDNKATEQESILVPAEEIADVETVKSSISQMSPDWQETFLQLFDNDAMIQANRLRRNSVEAPSAIGYELIGGKGTVVGEAEMVWEDEMIALLLAHQIGSRVLFEESGWTVIADADEYPKEGD